MLSQIPEYISNQFGDHLLFNKFKLNSVDGHKALESLLNKSVLSGGKRLRPILTFLFSSLVNLPRGRAKILAESIEYVHAASLAHDDVIDGAETRRSRPSINVLGDNKKAILAGDYLLSEVIQQLCLLKRPDLVSEMAKTIKNLSVGEWAQHDLIKSRDYESDSFEKISLLKTCSVMSWCSVAPLMLSEKDERTIGHAREFGKHLGLAFQYIDDVLDFLKTSNKDYLLDVQNNQLNSVSFHWLKQRPELLHEYKKGTDLNILLEVDKLNKSILVIQSLAKKHLEHSREELDVLCERLKIKTGNSSKKMILQLIDELNNRSN